MKLVKATIIVVLGNLTCLSAQEKFDPRDDLQIGPITGLTTEWHRLTKLVGQHPLPVPRGITLELRSPVYEHTKILWQGAQEVRNDGRFSVARCTPDQPGDYRALVRYFFIGGQKEVWIRLNVLDVELNDIQISPIRVSVDPVVLDEDDLNASTFEYFKSSSISALGKASEHFYYTSTGREVHLSVDVTPAPLAPLVEWHIDSRRVVTGASMTTAFQLGLHEIKLGTKKVEPVFLDAYKVRITSHLSNEDLVPDGAYITFEAETIPPGYEDEISWVASTKYGSCDPLTGRGQSFRVRFDDTYAENVITGGLFQWLGVKADNAEFNQDQKPVEISYCAPPGENCEAAESYCAYAVTGILSGDNDGDGVCDEDPNIFHIPGQIPSQALLCVTPCPFPPEEECIPHTFRVVGTNCVFTTRLLELDDVPISECVSCTNAAIYKRL